MRPYPVISVYLHAGGPCSHCMPLTYKDGILELMPTFFSCHLLHGCEYRSRFLTVDFVCSWRWKTTIQVKGLETNSIVPLYSSPLSLCSERILCFGVTMMVHILVYVVTWVILPLSLYSEWILYISCDCVYQCISSL